MRVAILVSAVAHVAILAWAFFGLVPPAPPKPPDAVPVEIVRLDEPVKPPEKRELKLEDDSSAQATDKKAAAEKKETADKAAADKAAAEKAAADQAAADQAAAEKAAATKPAADRSPDKTGAGKAGADTAAAAKPAADKPAPDKAAGDKAADRQALSRKALEAAPALGPVPTLGADDLRALINGPTQAEEGGVATSSLPAQLPADQVEAVRVQAQRCWEVPSGWRTPRQAAVAVRFRLRRDGSVEGKPVVTEFPASPIGKAAADRAVVAVQRCGPYQLPAESYDKWRVMEIHLVPGQ